MSLCSCVHRKILRRLRSSSPLPSASAVVAACSFRDQVSLFSNRRARVTKTFPGNPFLLAVAALVYNCVCVFVCWPVRLPGCLLAYLRVCESAMAVLSIRIRHETPEGSWPPTRRPSSAMWADESTCRRFYRVQTLQRQSR